MKNFFISLFFLAGLLVSTTSDGQAIFQTQQAKTWADSVLLDMSIDEKIGQLFMVSAYSNLGKAHRNEVLEQIKKYHVGGLIFFQGGPVRQAHLTNLYQSKSALPLMIGMDAEWGLNMRLDSTFKFPWAMTVGAVQDTELVYNMGVEMGKQCKRLGVHINFAPVLDINTNPNNPIINARSFGQDKEAVTWHAYEMMKGMQDAGVLACGKHFPGHGDTDKDSHKTLPSVSFDMTRLEEVELYPFRELSKKGLASVMVAHLNVPAIDKSGTPTSVSEKAVQELLIDKMGFDGLILTDALNMAGVANTYGPGDVELKSFLAGNDILLMPKDLELARTKLKGALKSGKITDVQLDYRVKKILMAKYWLHVDKQGKVETKNLVADLNSIRAEVLRKQLMQSAITLMVNKQGVLPITDLKDKKFACITMGVEQGTEFAKTLSFYDDVDHFVFDGKNGNEILNKLGDYNKVFIGVYTSNKNPWKSYKIKEGAKLFVKKVSLQSSIVITVFANPYSMRNFEEAEFADAVIMAYQNNKEAEQAAAQLIFGGISSKGKIPVNITSLFDAGYGIQKEDISRLAYALPEEVGIDRNSLAGIDSIANWAIAQEATPGCQILVAKDGKVFYNKSFGYQTYGKYNEITDEDIYDLASITKISATLPTLMQLHERGYFNLDDTLVKLIPEAKGTNKENLVVKDILTHKAGLEPWVPFFLATLKDQMPSEEFYAKQPNDSLNSQVARDLYNSEDYEDVMLKTILETSLGHAKYKYSDLGYYFFKRYIENTLHEPIENYTHDEFYEPLGANTLGYLPRNRFDEDRLVPTEHDRYFRYQLIRGYVHDQGASMSGGVGGHAGLFSNANDLAKLMQMYLQGGYYGGKRYLKETTLKEFTKCEFCKEDNRRGIGFDKPQIDGPGPACDCVSKLSYGHTGFTGTIAWADPDENIVYVFLSNRVCPDAENKKLITAGVRTNIQEEIYSALNTYQK